MKLNCIAALAGWIVAIGMASAQAGEVTIKETHLCCPMCVKAVATTLKDVDGISKANCDRQKKTVTFNAVDAKAAQAAVNALAKAGFHGNAKHDDEKLEFPKSGAKKGQKSDKITLQGVHLCCGACGKAVTEASKKVDGVSSVDVNRQEKTVTITGSSIDVAAAVAALNKAGFHGRMQE